MQLPGTPSDEIDGVVATGRGDISTLFVSMATRHPEGRDADYLQLAHPRPPARAAPAVGRARLTAAGFDAGVPVRASSGPGPL